MTDTIPAGTVLGKVTKTVIGSWPFHGWAEYETALSNVVRELEKLTAMGLPCDGKFEIIEIDDCTGKSIEVLTYGEPQIMIWPEEKK